MSQNQRRSGFTLVELIIVIVVIAVLAMITIVAYRGVSARAEDTRRIDTISKIRKALELYRVDTGTYPGSINSDAPNGTDDYPGGGWSISSLSPNDFLSALRPYLKTIPIDPVNNSSYYFYYFFYVNNPALCGSTTPNCYKLGVSKLKILDPLAQSGVDATGWDVWRFASSTRPVWTGSY